VVKAGSPTAGADELTLFDLLPGAVSFFAFHNVTIVVWHSTPDPLSVERLRLVSERRRKQHPKLSVIHMLHGAPLDMLPDTPTRHGLAQVVKEGQGTLALVAVLVPVAGFMASAIRGLLTGIRVASRGTFEMGLYADLEELVRWLPDEHRARTGVTLDKDALRRALQRALSFGQPDDPLSEPPESNS
jgi:hypothetical protein